MLNLILTDVLQFRRNTRPDRQVMEFAYTIVYRFMTKDLQLGGKTLLVFAMIFGLCRQKQEPLSIPLKVICDFTEASKSTVVTSIRSLEQMKLISAIHVHGKRTLYSVSPEVMKAYAQLHNNCIVNRTSPETVLVHRQDHNRYGTRTTTGSETRPHIIKDKIKSKGMQTDMYVSDYKPSATIKKLTELVQDSD